MPRAAFPRVGNQNRVLPKAEHIRRNSVYFVGAIGAVANAIRHFKLRSRILELGRNASIGVAAACSSGDFAENGCGVIIL